MMVGRLATALLSAACLSAGALSAQEEPLGKQHPVLFAISEDGAFNVEVACCEGIGDDRLKAELQSHASALLAGAGIETATPKKAYFAPTLQFDVAGAAVGDTTVYTLTLQVWDLWYNPGLRSTFDAKTWEPRATRFGDKGIRYFHTLFLAHMVGAATPVVVWSASLVRPVPTAGLGPALAGDADALFEAFLEAYAEANP
jgi:hypothetical protein